MFISILSIVYNNPQSRFHWLQSVHDQMGFVALEGVLYILLPFSLIYRILPTSSMMRRSYWVRNLYKVKSVLFKGCHLMWRLFVIFRGFRIVPD
ncbi:hypothetical protein BGZ57DRAFT_1010986 [Hyaloscypha finlandica]|nr:hypothetical protein BGZ57DRAFT_1010986 [Hyaloscypha finlandica]